MLTAEEFKCVFENRAKRGFGPGWTDVFYRKFHEIWPFCSITATDNRLRVENSRQGGRAPFWKGAFKCRVSPDCVKVVMTIADKPNEGSGVEVSVKIFGECSHMASHTTSDCEISTPLLNRRFLTGYMRQ
jgi:hypothetical protein